MTIDDRITEALRRITECMGPMRIPADPCDADLVLSDAKTELTALRAQLEAVARERDEARADAARLREALTQVRDAMRATGQEPDGDDDPRRPVASAVWHALDSTPSAEPTPREADVARLREALVGMRCRALPGRTVPCACPGCMAARAALASTPAPGPTRAEAEAWVGDGEAVSGMLAHSAESAPGPTEREMRVAEAVVEAFRTKVVATTAWLAGTRHCLSVAERLDLRTIAAKAVEP